MLTFTPSAVHGDPHMVVFRVSGGEFTVTTAAMLDSAVPPLPALTELLACLFYTEKDRAVRPSTPPAGLCADRSDHAPHAVTSGSLAPYWCCADQSRRLPACAERDRKGAGTCQR